MSLRVQVDGVELAEGQALAFWKRFSAWMEERAGDLAGFAQAEGFLSVHPRMEAGEPLLVVSRTVPQGAYVPARSTPGGADKKSGHRSGGGKPGKKPRRKAGGR